MAAPARRHWRKPWRIEVEEAVGVADAAIIVVSGKDGVQVGTEKAWELCEEHNLPRMIFVTEMDNDDVSYREVVEKLQELFGKKIAPLHMPIRENGKFVGYVNIVKKAGRHYIAKGRKEECPVPDYLKEYLDKYRETLLESVAETSDEYMDRYFSGDEFSVAEISAALATNIDACAIVPVCMGSPVNLQGVSNLLDDICEYFPDPSKRPCTGINTKTNEIFEANYDFQKAKSAYVWKTISDPFIGKYSLIKVCSGTLKSDDTLFDVDKGNEERLSQSSATCRQAILSRRSRRWSRIRRHFCPSHTRQSATRPSIRATTTKSRRRSQSWPLRIGRSTMSLIPQTIRAFSMESAISRSRL